MENNESNFMGHWLIVIAAAVGAIFFFFLFLVTLKEFIHMIRNPNYHKEALRATEIIRRGNKGEDISNVVDNFNQTCIYDMLIKRTFEMVADKDGLHIGGKYYLYEGRFNRRNDGFGAFDSTSSLF